LRVKFSAQNVTDILGTCLVETRQSAVTLRSADVVLRIVSTALDEV